MNYDKAKDLMMDYISGDLNPEQKVELDSFIANNPEYHSEFEELKFIWGKMDSPIIPEPGKQMDTNFYEMLSEEKSKAHFAKESIFDRIAAFFQSLNIVFNSRRLAFGISILIVGLTIGYTINMGNKKDNQISQLANEMQQMREMMMLTLLEQPSANKRLQAVSMTNELPDVDEKVANALLKTLNNDPNVNVRLVTVEALSQFTHNSVVRQGLVISITKQESPLVQMALANLMVTLQEKKSVESLKKLLKKKELNETVRGKIEESIKVLL